MSHEKQCTLTVPMFHFVPKPGIFWNFVSNTKLLKELLYDISLSITNYLYQDNFIQSDPIFQNDGTWTSMVMLRKYNSYRINEFHLLVKFRDKNAFLEN